MIRITETLAPFPDYHEALGFEPEQTLFFDIETTGLSPASSMVFLIGTLHYNGDSAQNGSGSQTEWILTQYLCEHMEEEKELLRQFQTDASSFSTLVHFNGATFDIPYLEAKLKQHGLPPLMRTETALTAADEDCGSEDTADCTSDRTKRCSIDLYQKFRPLKSMLGMERMNQISLETKLGWQREDRLTGKHMITLFRGYAKSGEIGPRDLILLHNHDDLIGMTKLLPLGAYTLLFRGETEDLHAKLSDSSDRLVLSFLLKEPLPFPLLMESPLPLCTAHSSRRELTDTNPAPTASFCLHIQAAEGRLELPCFRGELKYFFPDHKNYYYLPLEDQAIHKSLALYIEKEYRQKANPDTCYTKRSSLFVRQPDALFTPVFRDCRTSPDLYFEFEESFLQNKKALHTLLCAVLYSFSTILNKYFPSENV